MKRKYKTCPVCKTVFSRDGAYGRGICCSRRCAMPGAVAKRPAPKSTPAIERFWKHVVKSDGCWLWDGRKNGNTYATIRVGSNGEKAHRFSYEIAYGPIPPGLVVMHKCDTPACVRPDHLELGTQGDNNRDREKKNRGNHAFGERNGSAKLTQEISDKIRERFNSGATQLDICAEFGISIRTLDDIVRGRRWADGTQAQCESRKFGDHHKDAKLTCDDVRVIRRTYAGGGIYQREIANRYGISQTVVSAIIRRKTWVHVAPD